MWRGGERLEPLDKVGRTASKPDIPLAAGLEHPTEARRGAGVGDPDLVAAVKAIVDEWLVEEHHLAESGRDDGEPLVVDPRFREGRRGSERTIRQARQGCRNIRPSRL